MKIQIATQIGDLLQQPHGHTGKQIWQQDTNEKEKIATQISEKL